MMGSIESKERPGIDEVYMVATASSNLRVGNDHTIITPGDMVAAAGMNKHRTGLALLRLMSEWDAGATPHQKPDGSVERAEARRRIAEVTRWEDQENVLRFLRLRSLPTLRAGLLRYVQAKGWTEGEHLVAAVLQRFLSPVCPECHGRKNRVIEGTARLGSKECRLCKGSGEAKIGYGGKGYRLLEHIHACLGSAASDQQQGARRLSRTGSNDEARQRQAARDRGEQETVIAEEGRAEMSDSERAEMARVFAMGKSKRHDKKG